MPIKEQLSRSAIAISLLRFRSIQTDREIWPYPVNAAKFSWPVAIGDRAYGPGVPL